MHDPVEPDLETAPPASVRMRAASAYLSVPTAGLFLPLALVAWRGSDPFLSHHGRRATIFTLALILVVALHSLLHVALREVMRLETYAIETLGAPPLTWELRALDMLAVANWTVMAAEIACCIGAALWAASKVLRPRAG